jgi:hypothetical protein
LIEESKSFPVSLPSTSKLQLVIKRVDEWNAEADALLVRFIELFLFAYAVNFFNFLAIKYSKYRYAISSEVCVLIIFAYLMS